MRTQPHSRMLWLVLLAPMAAAILVTACNGGSDDNNTGQSVTITAPGVVGPNSSTPIGDDQPTLTVTNASVSDGTAPTYTFQVASDQGFGSVVVQVTGVAQGSGQTSWEVSQALSPGTYFWRARAVVASTNGPFSAVATFEILGVGGGPGETVVVFDDLTGGSTLASERRGGTLMQEGWRVENNTDFLRYSVPTVTNGYVQWQNVGLTPTGANGASYLLLSMWDPDAGAYRQNPFRVHLLKLWGPTHFPPFMRLRWISQGREEETGTNFTDWNPSQVYTWRVEWGPQGPAFRARVLLDGREMLALGYNRRYQPNTHFIELGNAERGESVIDAIYRNFVVVRRD